MKREPITINESGNIIIQTINQVEILLYKRSILLKFG